MVIFSVLIKYCFYKQKKQNTKLLVIMTSAMLCPSCFYCKKNYSEQSKYISLSLSLSQEPTNNSYTMKAVSWRINSINIMVYIIIYVSIIFQWLQFCIVICILYPRNEKLVSNASCYKTKVYLSFPSNTSIMHKCYFVIISSTQCIGIVKSEHSLKKRRAAL